MSRIKSADFRSKQFNRLVGQIDSENDLGLIAFDFEFGGFAGPGFFCEPFIEFNRSSDRFAIECQDDIADLDSADDISGGCELRRGPLAYRSDQTALWRVNTVEATKVAAFVFQISVIEPATFRVPIIQLDPADGPCQLVERDQKPG